jgi:adenosine deaminase
VPECVETFKQEDVQASFRSGAVKGIGLDSSEFGFPPELFEEIYTGAGAMGMRLTAHAGEEAPPAYIQSALDTLKVERIDHGRRLPEDPELLARIAKEGKLLTLCPISNVFLRGVSSVSELPIREFLAAGVQFSLNSDDPAYFGNLTTTLLYTMLST